MKRTLTAMQSCLQRSDHVEDVLGMVEIGPHGGKGGDDDEET